MYTCSLVYIPISGVVINLLIFYFLTLIEGYTLYLSPNNYIVLRYLVTFYLFDLHVNDCTYVKFLLQFTFCKGLLYMSYNKTIWKFTFYKILMYIFFVSFCTCVYVYVFWSYISNGHPTLLPLYLLSSWLGYKMNSL